MTTIPRIDVDYNARNWDGLVLAGFEAFHRVIASTGLHVLAWQVDDDRVADATVERIDADKKLAYLRVKWDTLREAEESAPEVVIWHQSYYLPLANSGDSVVFRTPVPELTG